jgi:hypothetical protein
MNTIKQLKIELLCITFGLFGIFLSAYNKAPDIGATLNNTIITAYFAFKKTDNTNND